MRDDSQEMTLWSVSLTETKETNDEEAMSAKLHANIGKSRSLVDVRLSRCLSDQLSTLQAIQLLLNKCMFYFIERCDSDWIISPISQCTRLYPQLLILSLRLISLVLLM